MCILEQEIGPRAIADSSEKWAPNHFYVTANAQLAFELREAQKAVDGSVGLLARAKTTFLQQAGEPSQETREAEQRLQAVKDTINAESLQGLVH